MKSEFPNKWKYLSKNLAYPYESFNSIKDYEKPVQNFPKEDFFSKPKNDHPKDIEMERRKD